MNQLSEKTQSQFYAQYLGQKVLRHSDYKKDDECMELEYVHLSDDWMRHYLLLRKVEQLTESEISTLLTAIGWDFNIKYILDFSAYISHCGIACINFDGTSDEQVDEINNIGVDYLRSIGILLPFTYLQDGNPRTLTVEQIIELGWVKIKE